MHRVPITTRSPEGAKVESHLADLDQAQAQAKVVAGET